MSVCVSVVVGGVCKVLLSRRALSLEVPFQQRENLVQGEKESVKVFTSIQISGEFLLFTPCID